MRVVAGLGPYPWLVGRSPTLDTRIGLGTTAMIGFVPPVLSEWFMNTIKLRVPHLRQFECCNLMGLQIFCSGTKPIIAVVHNPTRASRVRGGAGSDGTERDWGAGSWLLQSSASSGKQQEQGLPFLTQEHLKQQQHRGLGRVGDRACGT